MGLMNLKWIPRLIRWMAPFRKAEMEAADQYLGKKSKSQTLHDLTMVRDTQELAKDDRAKVRALHKKHGMDLQGGKSGGDSDTWACDDMTINAGGKSNLLEMLLVLALGAAGMWWFNKDKAQPAAPTPTQPAVNVPDTEYEVRFYDKDGNQITVPRLPAKP